MYIELPPEHKQFIQNQVASGKYSNPEEVVVKALKLLEEWEDETLKKVTVGLSQIERGEVLDSKVVMARLEEKLKKARENQEQYLTTQKVGFGESLEDFRQKYHIQNLNIDPDYIFENMRDRNRE
jgi:antitoxin ParD1/3/4